MSKKIKKGDNVIVISGKVIPNLHPRWPSIGLISNNSIILFIINKVIDLRKQDWKYTVT